MAFSPIPMFCLTGNLSSRARERHGSAPARQRGLSLIEVSIVTAIVLLIAIIGIPAIGTYVIENKVPALGEALQRFVVRTKANAQGGGPTPYAEIDTAALANALRDATVVTISGDDSRPSIGHGLGGVGVGDNGTISVQPADLLGAGAGSAFTLTLTQVNHAACPGLASVMQAVSDVITVAGAGGPVVVKDDSRNPVLHYNAGLAAAQCARGDVNTFIFTTR